MTTIKPEALESSQVYPDRFGNPRCYGDVYTRFHCQRCGALLPEGATEDDEICKGCKEEEEINNVK